MVVKIRERKESANINESCRIEKQIYDVGEYGVFRLTVEVTTMILAQKVCGNRHIAHFQAKAQPHAKADSKSSLPKRTVPPILISLITL